MIIEKILKQLTPERVKETNEEVMRIRLPLTFLRWVKEYNALGEQNRNDYFWKWLYRTAQAVTLPLVIKKYRKQVWSIKLLLLMFVTLFDDIADKYTVRSKKLLDEMLKIPYNRDCIKFNNLTLRERKYIKFTIKVWCKIENTIKRYPKYKYLRGLFEYDVIQLLNAMEYAYLVNENPFIINTAECWLYPPHNMQAILSLDIDLIYSSVFDFKKIGAFREIAWKSQEMARIGNWVSTWEREVGEKDFTSGVFAYAIISHLLTFNELKTDIQNKLKIIKKIRHSRIEKKLLAKWEQCYWEINRLGKKAGLPYIKEFLQALRKLIFFHLSSRGYK